MHNRLYTYLPTYLSVVRIVEQPVAAAAVAGHEERGLLVGRPQVLVQQELGCAVVVDQVAVPVLLRVHPLGKVAGALSLIVACKVCVDVGLDQNTNTIG